MKWSIISCCFRELSKGNLVFVFILAFLMSFSVFNVKAQVGYNIDSLKNAILAMEVDTFKVCQLIELSAELVNTGSYADARKYAEELLALSEKLDYDYGMGIGHNLIGLTCKNLGDYKEAIRYYKIAVSYLEESGNLKNLAGTQINIANLYSMLGDFEEAIKHYQKSLATFEALELDKGISLTAINLGITLKRLGRYSEALNCFERALIIHKRNQDKVGMAHCFSSMSGVFYNQGKYTESLKLELDAMSIFEEMRNRSALAGSLANIGSIYLQQENFQEATEHINAALKIYEELGSTSGIASCYQNLGVVHLRKEEFKKAEEYFQDALNIYKELGKKEAIAASLSALGAVHFKIQSHVKAKEYYTSSLELQEVIGDKRGITDTHLKLGELFSCTSDYEDAYEHLQVALIRAKEIGDKMTVRDVYAALASTDSLTENYQQYIANFKNYILYKDSLHHETNNKIIEELKINYETDKKDKIIEGLFREKQISELQLMVQQESAIRARMEKDKVNAENLLNLQQIDLLNNESKLQQTQLAWSSATMKSQEASMKAKQDSLKLLEREGEIHQLKLKSKTALANYLMGAFLVLCLLGFMAYKQYHTRQQLKLQKLRNKIASDLHDDVGSTLSSISIFSEMAQQQSKEVQPLLQTIQNSSRNMLEAMADIVWTINPENDQFEKIVMRMRNFAFELLGAKQIDFEFNADEEINRMKLPMDIRKNLYLIFKEATNNLVKYSEASEAEFSIRNEEDKVVMMIRDNGKGFDPDQPSEGNGLKSMRKRAADMGADFLVKSFPGQGTMIQLKIAV